MSSKPKEDAEQGGDNIETVSSPGSDIELVCEHPAGQGTKGAEEEAYVFVSQEDAPSTGDGKDTENRPQQKVYPDNQVRAVSETCQVTNQSTPARKMQDETANDDLRLVIDNMKPQVPFEDTPIATEKLPEDCLKLHPSNFGADGGPVCGCLCCRRAPEGDFQASEEAQDEEGIEMHPLGVTRQNTPNYASAPPGSREKPVMYPYNRCTINWCGWIRRLVSKKKRRYIGDGFDLDLSYILNNVVATGFPSVSVEALYRNPREELQHFLAVRYGKRYKVYNLCCEPQHRYDPAIFSNQVSTYPFEDHNAPPANFMFAFCDDMYRFLLDDQRNVAIVHCKAGKGRTGQMLCCYLLHCGAFDDPEACMSFYAHRRTFNKKGVTIPSQRRYIHYYALQLRALRFKRLKLDDKVTVTRGDAIQESGGNAGAAPGQGANEQPEAGNEGNMDEDGKTSNTETNSAEYASRQHASEGEVANDMNESEDNNEDTSGNTKVTTAGNSIAKETEVEGGNSEKTEEQNEDQIPLGPWTLSMDPRRIPERPMSILACSFFGDPGPFESFVMTITTMDDYLGKNMVCDTSANLTPHPASENEEGYPDAETILPLSAAGGQSIFPVPRSCGVATKAEGCNAVLPDSTSYLPAGPPFHLRPERETPRVPVPRCSNTMTFQGEQLGDQHEVHVSGNVNVELRGIKSEEKKSKKICSFWVHTGFLPLHSISRGDTSVEGTENDEQTGESANDDATHESNEKSSGDDRAENRGTEELTENQTDDGVSYGHIVLNKFELDKAVKDKKHKKLPANFSCVLIYKCEREKGSENSSKD